MSVLSPKLGKKPKQFYRLIKIVLAVGLLPVPPTILAIRN